MVNRNGYELSTALVRTKPLFPIYLFNNRVGISKWWGGWAVYTKKASWISTQPNRDRLAGIKINKSINKRTQTLLSYINKPNKSSHLWPLNCLSLFWSSKKAVLGGLNKYFQVQMTVESLFCERDEISSVPVEWKRILKFFPG